MVRIHYEVPDEVHREAKAAAARLGITLREFVIRALERAVRDPEPPAERPT